MNYTLNEAIHHDINDTVKSSLYGAIQLGSTSFSRFYLDNKAYFSKVTNRGVLTRLLNSGINGALLESAFTPDAVYQAEQISTNNFGENIVILKTPNLFFTPSKIRKKQALPSPSGYKKRYSMYNQNSGRQFYFDPTRELLNPPYYFAPPYYGMITYQYNFDALECASPAIIFPDEQYKERLETIPIDEISHSHISVVPPQEEEAIVAKLNEKFEKIIKKGEKNG